MRKVLFKNWIPAVFPEGANSANQHLPGFGIMKGTGCWESNYSTIGLFHCWGSAFESFETGPANYTIAVIELENGEIREMEPRNIKFVDQTEFKVNSTFLIDLTFFELVCMPVAFSK